MLQIGIERLWKKMHKGFFINEIDADDINNIL